MSRVNNGIDRVYPIDYMYQQMQKKDDLIDNNLYEIYEKLDANDSLLADNATDLVLTGTKIQLKKADGTKKGTGIDIPTVGIDDSITSTSKVWSSQKVNTQLTNIGNASPKGAYGTLSALQTAFPTGTTGIYLVTADTKWYYWNGSAWTAGGVYQPSLVDGTVTINKTDFLAKYQNLFDASKGWTNGYVNQTDGTITTGTSSKVGDFIPVTQGKTYKTNGVWNSGYYDTNKVFVQGLANFNGNLTVPTGTGIAYVRIAWDNASSATAMFVEGTTIPPFYVPYSATPTAYILDDPLKTAFQNLISVDVSKLTFFTKYQNLFDQTLAVSGYINPADGTVTANSGAMVSDFMPVTEGVTYKTNGSWNSGYYDVNKVFKQSLASYNGTVTVPTGTGIKFVRIAFATADFNKGGMFVQGSALPSRYIPYSASGYYLDITDSAVAEIMQYEAKLRANIDNPIYGLKWNVLGDSITFGIGATNAQYHKVIGDKNNLTITNYGISGNRISGGTNPMSTRYTGMDDTADIITVLGGTNDYANQVPLGTISSTDTATFYGALNVLCQGLRTKYAPEKRIGFITPLHRNTSADVGVSIPLQSYIDAIKAVCNKWSIPCFDLYANGSLSPEIDYIKTNYFDQADGLHPNAAGHRVMSRVIEPWLKTL